MKQLLSRTCRLAVLVIAAASGCGTGRYPVTGRVTYDDGSPVSEGTVIGVMGEGPKNVSVQGRIESNGRFSLGTDRPGDGVKPGKYQVAIMPRTLGDQEIAKGAVPAVDGKFTSPQTSGIEIDVKPGSNELNIKVYKPKNSR